MNIRDLVAGTVGAVIGAAGMYFVLDRIHTNDITTLLEDIDAEMMQKANASLNEMYGGARFGVDFGNGIDAEEGTDVVGDLKSLDTIIESSPLVSRVWDDGGEGEEGEEGVDPLEDPEEDEDMTPATQMYDGVYMIDPKKVGPIVVIGTYNHDDGSVEIDVSISAKTDLDEIIENNELFALINEEAFDILMSAGEREEGTERRMIAVRNSVLNLDFVITY